ncbi:uncharacterized protein LOC111249553 [Varroa destructor]|uniref:Uncharacterized protein n=1 Tax=Varroa destructor TaxID=109461 RepID=A0A7M7JZK0_VARDE|nr:uncharacterized protein LOC111249553 [Varroa destructor]
MMVLTSAGLKIRSSVIDRAEDANKQILLVSLAHSQCVKKSFAYDGASEWRCISSINERQDDLESTPPIYNSVLFSQRKPILFENRDLAGLQVDVNNFAGRDQALALTSHKLLVTASHEPVIATEQKRQARIPQ